MVLTFFNRDLTVNIIILSRLMYRKGIDLLIAAIPQLCLKDTNVHFIIGGEGPKRVELEQMRERFALQDRVEMCGTIRQAEVQNVSTMKWIQRLVFVLIIVIS